MNREHRLNLLKMIPGLLISAFFLWWTFHGFNVKDLENIHFTAPLWIVGLLAGTCASYWLRSYRWWVMMRSAKSRPLPDFAPSAMAASASRSTQPLFIDA